MSETEKADGKKTIELPVASYPLVWRVIAENPFPPPTPVVQPGQMPPPPQPPQPVLWLLGEAHPIVPDHKIMRMYVILGVAVEVYSASADGKIGSRYTLPWSCVKLTEEVMDPETFVEEILEADKENSDDDPEPPAPTLPKTNGVMPTA